MRLLLAGDLHGTTEWMERLCGIARQRSCQTIVQLGDFGFWEHEKRGEVFLDDVSDLLWENDLHCVWLDGNHENHTLLRSRYIDAGHRDHDGFWIVRPRLVHADRGHRWTWDGVRFLALGGAYSIDLNPRPWQGWPGRVEGQSWWPEETITDEECARACEGGPVDVMLTHDVPWGVAGAMGPGRSGFQDDYPVSAANRKRLRDVVAEVAPKVVFHGHYHHRNSGVLELDGRRTPVEGLANEWRPGSWLVLEVVDGEVGWGERL